MWQKKLNRFFINYWPFLLSAFFWILLTLPSFFGTHVLNNLEPSPDSLYYLGRARQFVFTGQFKLIYQDTHAAATVSPVYSIFLIPFFLIKTTPQIFVLANLWAAILTLFIIYSLVKKQTKSHLAAGISLLIISTHLSLIWFVGLPMVEIFALSLLATCIYFLFHQKLLAKQLVVLSLLLLALILTKYLYVSIVAACALITLAKLFRDNQFQLLRITLGTGFIGCIFLLLYFQKVAYNPFDIFSYLFKPNLNYTRFYDFANLIPNFTFYLNVFLGQPVNLLWEKTVLSSAGMLLLFIWSLIKLWQRQTTRILSLSLGLIFLSLFPIVLLFITTDARYIIFAPVIMALAIGLAWPLFQGKQKYWFNGLLTLALVWQVVTQLPLLKTIVSQNVLHRSTAWQYEAIITFNDQFLTLKENYLITSLPPFFVDFYDNNNYRVLPLSKNQEFINKGQWVWGNDLKNDNLENLYNELLANKNQIFISNAYVTHSHEVTADFENLKKSYDFILVQEGCAGACNIYQLTN